MRVGFAVVVGVAIFAAIKKRRWTRRRTPDPAPTYTPRAAPPWVRTPDDSNAGTELFSLLRRKHDQLNAQAAELLGLPTGRLEERVAAKTKMQRLVIDASKHEAVEETYLWPLVRDTIDGGEAMVRLATEQELAGRRLLHDLENRKPEDPDFRSLLETFSLAVAAHITYEERTIWPAMLAALDENRRDQLAAQLVAGRATAPTRPHPSAPASPGRHERLGKAIVLFDHTADRITRRGK